MTACSSTITARASATTCGRCIGTRSRVSVRGRRSSNGTPTCRHSRRWSTKRRAPIACSERSVASLRELQRSFATALHDPAADCAVHPATRLSIYRNTVHSNFLKALEAIFPVLRRRVGDDFFAQLAHHYREKFPSRSGDLHWV